AIQGVVTKSDRAVVRVMLSDQSTVRVIRELPGRTSLVKVAGDVSVEVIFEDFTASERIRLSNHPIRSVVGESQHLSALICNICQAARRVVSIPDPAAERIDSFDQSIQRIIGSSRGGTQRVGPRDESGNNVVSERR